MDDPLTGGAFLVESSPGSPLFTPEQLTDEHRAIARTVDEFWVQEVEPELDALRRLEPGVARGLLTRAAALGLTAMQIPEEYGGLALDLASVMVAVEHLSRDASYLGWHLGQSGIGTLPLVYYGTEDQKRRYLPRLASVELLAAYALTEPEAGSDALAIRTRADLSADGRHYRLNGRKMWITNGGEADLFTVFAKVGGEAFTAFLVERAFGVESGAQEHKMGIEGTSTTALYFDDVPVPVENVLGQIGRGHEIAFNVLNVGRLEIGPNAVCGARTVLDVSLRYACDRRAFGKPIAEFGAIRQKLADCATGIFATGSATWRVVGLVQAAIDARRAAGLDQVAAELAAFEEFAIECALIKVLASEMLDQVADEGVQIHGGYGYHRDYYVERAYRDARINRIFEGTNEINRIVIASQLFKRSSRGRLALVETAERTLDSAGDLASCPPATDAASMVANARTLTQIIVGLAARRWDGALRDEQEVALALADAAIETFAAESALLRAQTLAPSPDGPPTAAMATLQAREGLRRVARAAETVVAASGQATEPSVPAAVDALARTAPTDVIALRRAVAAALVEQQRYWLA